MRTEDCKFLMSIFCGQDSLIDQINVVICLKQNGDFEKALKNLQDFQETMELTKISDEASPLPFEEDLYEYDIEGSNLAESGIMQDQEEMKASE